MDKMGSIQSIIEICKYLFRCAVVLIQLSIIMNPNLKVNIFSNQIFFDILTEIFP